MAVRDMPLALMASGMVNVIGADISVFPQGPSGFARALWNSI